MKPKTTISPKSPTAESAWSESSSVATRIERLRQYRGRRPQDAAIGGIVESIRRDAMRHQRQAGSFTEAWQAVIPEPLRQATRIQGLRAGVARVGVRDAATRYELEAGLRSGWLVELRMASGDPIRRVQCGIEPGL